MLINRKTYLHLHSRLFLFLRCCFSGNSCHKSWKLWFPRVSLQATTLIRVASRKLGTDCCYLGIMKHFLTFPTSLLILRLWNEITRLVTAICNGSIEQSSVFKVNGVNGVSGVFKVNTRKVATVGGQSA